ncbi:MAG: hypothetical protein RIR39_2102, partial [Pseudomonadota bacterium]
MKSVKIYRSDDAGAPVVSGVADTVIHMLNAVLCTGYNSNTISSITTNAGIATVTSTGHGFNDGDWVRISGATLGSGHNTDWLIKRIDNNSYSY